jgi:hypothetical protein
MKERGGRKGQGERRREGERELGGRERERQRKEGRKEGVAVSLLNQFNGAQY